MECEREGRLKTNRFISHNKCFLCSNVCIVDGVFSKLYHAETVRSTMRVSESELVHNNKWRCAS